MGNKRIKELFQSMEKILQLRPLLAKGLQFNIGSGDNIRLWYDPWLDHQNLINTLGHQVALASGIPLHAKLNSLMVNGELRWTLPNLNSLSDLANVNLLVVNGAEDAINWSVGDVGSFSTKSARNLARTPKAKVKEIMLCWKPHAVPKCSFISWLIFKKRLPTLDKLKSWNIQLTNWCCLCRMEEESIDHLLVGCSYSKTVWDSVRAMAKISPILATSVEDLFKKASLLFRDNSEEARKGRLCFNLTLYYLWLERNARIFKEEDQRPWSLGVTIWSLANAYLSN